MPEPPADCVPDVLQCAHMPKKSEDIKVRVDALTKRALVQIAEEELLELSDIVRRALYDFVAKKSKSTESTARVYGNV